MQQKQSIQFCMIFRILLSYWVQLNVNFMQNDASAAIIPHEHWSSITSHKMKSELENCVPFSKSIITLAMICQVLHMTTEKQKQCVYIFLLGIEKKTMKLRIMSQYVFQCHAIVMVTNFDRYLIIMPWDKCTKYKINGGHLII